MKKIFYSVLFISTFIFSSCVGDLDQFPHKETTSADVYAEAANYKAVLGKLYVSFVTAGQEKAVAMLISVVITVRIICVAISICRSVAPMNWHLPGLKVIR